jgi:alpha-methylacyl-CoA racemase
VVELGGIGPGPFAGMMLADMGADVLRLHRVETVDRGDPWARLVLDRGRRSLAVDLKAPEGVACVLALTERADALVEGFRPGVVERLGVGPDVCLERNPRLVYGRMTGWGQEGPLASVAGHDINYIALAGVLAQIGRPHDRPVVPLNLVADFGGGGMLLAFGIMCALFERNTSGTGQVVDAAMVDGAAALMAMMWGMRAAGTFHEERGANILDGGAPFYDTYATADGKHVAIGAIESKFYAQLLDLLGLDDTDLPVRSDEGSWPELREILTGIFRERTRDEWCELLEGTDVCFAPVLTMSEAADHPHLRARGTIVERDGVLQPAPAPRFSRSVAGLDRPMPAPGAHTDEVLTEWGFERDEIDRLHDTGAIRQAAHTGVEQ